MLVLMLLPLLMLPVPLFWLLRMLMAVGNFHHAA